MKTDVASKRTPGAFRPLLMTALVIACWPGTLTGQQADGLLDRAARLELDARPLGAALEALRRASGVALAWSPDVVPVEDRVDCPCGEFTVRRALEHLLDGTGLVFEERGRQILIGRREDPARVDLAGVVLDPLAGAPVPTAEVTHVETGRSALADDGGRFVLRDVGPRPVTLRVRSLGYEDRELTAVPGSGPLSIELVRRPIPLEEIVIAPGRMGVLEVTPGMTGSRVTRSDIEAIPQFGDDVFRTLKRMPGVASGDISTRLNVRGGTDRDLLVYLDGVELYEPYHLKDLDGALGIIDVQSLGGVDLVTGGFPAEYGDRTAGVFNMYSRQAPPEGTRTTLGVSLSSVSAINQGSFADGRGQWLASLRRGFLEYVLAVGGVEDEMDPRYWDALTRVQYLLGDDHLAWVEVLHAGDDLDWFDEQTRSRISSSWANSYLWTGWEGRPLERLSGEAVLSAGRMTRERLGDVDNPNGGPFTPLSADVADRADFDFVGLRQDWALELTGDLVLKFGNQLRDASADYDYASVASRYDLTATNQLYVRTDSNRVMTAPDGREVGSYLSLRGRVGPLTWEAGARHDWQEHTGDDDVSPRLLARLDVGPRTIVRASAGRYVQSHGLHELSTGDGERSFTPSERARQIAAGIEHDFGRGMSGRLEVYHRSIDRPRPIHVNLSRSVNPLLEVEGDRRRLEPEEARATGVEMIVSRDGFGDLSWSASYALSRAQDLIDGAWAPRTLDQRHTVNLRGAWDMGSGWQLSGAWNYHTGWPFTEQFLEIDTGLSEDGTETIDVLRREFGPYNESNLPAYHRLDLRLTKAFATGAGRLEVFLDVFNAYDRTNLRGLEWVLRRGPDGVLRGTPVSGEEQLPLLPTLGMRWVF